MKSNIMILIVLSSVLAACSQPTTKQVQSNPFIKYDINNKPAYKSIDSVRYFLDERVTKGKNLADNFCKDTYSAVASDFFSPTKYEILKNQTDDMFYHPISTAYWNSYDLRIWSSTKGGTPIVKEWRMTVKYGEIVNTSSQKWCIENIVRLD